MRELRTAAAILHILFLMSWFLTTARLGLRRFCLDDTEPMIALDSDTEVLRYINGGVPLPRQMLVDGLRDKLIPAWDPWCQSDRRTFFAACRLTSGRFVGWFHLKPGHHWPNELELGYRLLRDMWGQGLATEGAAAVRDFVFGPLHERAPEHAAVLTAATMIGNVASRRVMEKIGMTLEREFIEPRWPGADKTAVKLSMRRPQPT